MNTFNEKLKSELYRLGTILIYQKHNMDITSQLYFRFMETYYHVHQKRKQIRKQDTQNIKDMGMELLRSEKENTDRKITYIPQGD